MPAIDTQLFASLISMLRPGTNTDRSDYDIAVSGVTDYDKLIEDIDNLDTLYSIDIVNLDKCTNHLLIEDIKKYGRKIL